MMQSLQTLSGVLFLRFMNRRESTRRNIVAPEYLSIYVGRALTPCLIILPFSTHHHHRFVADIPSLSEHNARRVVGALAVALQASLLWRRSDSRIADAFCASRLCSAGRVEYGTLPDDVEFDFIIGRSVPSYQPE